MQVQEKYRIWVWDCTGKWCHPMNHWNYWCFLSYTSFLALVILGLGTAAKVLLSITRNPRSHSVQPDKTGREGKRHTCIRLWHACEGAEHDCQWWISKIGEELARSFIGNSGCGWTDVKMGSWSVFPSKKVSTRLEIFLRIKRNWKKHLSSCDLFFSSTKAGYCQEEEEPRREEGVLSSEGKLLKVKWFRYSG